MLPRLFFSHLLVACLLLSFFPGEVRAQKVDDPPKKLCGSEFVWTMIAVCGGGWGKNTLLTPRPSLREQMSVSPDSVGKDGHTEDTEKNQNDIKATDLLGKSNYSSGAHFWNKTLAEFELAQKCCRLKCTKKDIALVC